VGDMVAGGCGSGLWLQWYVGMDGGAAVGGGGGEGSE
jgi:hypothetical protein